MADTLFDIVEKELPASGARKLERSITFPRPAWMLYDEFGEGLTLELAVKEQIQNHVDAAMIWGTDLSISELEPGVWSLSDGAQGYDKNLLRYLTSSKRKKDSQAQVCVIGYKGIGMKAADHLMITTPGRDGSSPLSVVHRSRDWIGRPIAFFPAGTPEDSLMEAQLAIDLIEGLGWMQGSSTMIYNVPEDVEHVLKSPHDHFLYFREKMGWKPLYVHRGERWKDPEADSVISLNGGEVWLQGAKVARMPRLLLSYNLNSIRVPDDEYRTKVDNNRSASAVGQLLSNCHDTGIIDHIIRSGIEGSGVKDAVEWSQLNMAWLDNDLKDLYRQRFYSMFGKEGKRNPVIKDPHSSESKVRLERAAAKLGADVITLDATLARFLHGCGVEYDTRLLTDFEKLLTLPLSEFPSDGHPVFVDNLYLRSSYGISENSKLSLPVQIAMGAMEYARRFGFIGDSIQLLVDHNGKEMWVDYKDYPRFYYSNIDPSSSLDSVRRDLFGDPKEFRLRLPDEIGGTDKERYFGPVKAVRVNMPVKGGLKPTDLGELDTSSQPSRDEVPDLIGEYSSLTDEQKEASDLLNRSFVTAAKNKREIVLRSTNFVASPSQRTTKGLTRNYLDLLVGLREDPTLTDRAAIIMGASDEAERMQLLDLVFNLPSYVLHFRKGYTPITRTDSTEIVALDNRNAYTSGFYAGELGHVLFSYNFKNIRPLADIWNTEYSIRNAVLGSSDQRVFTEIIKASTPASHDEHAYGRFRSLTEICDYFAWAKQHDVVVGEQVRTRFREAFRSLYGRDAVVASSKGFKPEENQVKNGMIIIGNQASGVRQTVDMSFIRWGMDLETTVTNLGYRVVEVHPEMAKTLKESGILDDMDIAARDCRYIPDSRMIRGESLGSGDRSGMHYDYFSDSESTSIRLGRELLKLVGEYTGQQYDLVVFDHAVDDAGQPIPNYIMFSNVRKGQKTTIYARSDIAVDQKSFINGIFDIAVDQDMAQDIVMKNLYSTLEQRAKQPGDQGVVQTLLRYISRH